MVILINQPKERTMSTRSGYPSTMFVALARPGENARAIIGTDAIFYVDGRNNRNTVQNKIYERYSSYLNKGWKILGYERPRDYSGTVYPL